ncbi:MAG: MmcQ/YjbR family DNA-binding protein [Acidobacteria bacterium]|nr:MmcQ/YjbR family DNA-binding protein [Acidobacteriota bacterium]
MPKANPLTPEDFRRAALSFPGAHEGSHHGAADFRLGGRIFATLAHQAQGLGNLFLDPAQQNEFIATRPGIFTPAPGGWGRMGITHIVLAAATKDDLARGLETAYTRRAAINAAARRKRPAASKMRLL